MKRLFFVPLCLSVASAFAGPYDIEEFTAKNAGSPDNFITAEFGGELKTAPADEVSSLQDGRLVVRQKYTDPFGETETAYQLYQGAKGNLSSIVALKADGVDYSKLVTAKFYARRGMPAEDDVETVYFDGKSVFIPGYSTAFAFIDGASVQLTGAAPAEEPPSAKPAVASSEEEECDEYDPDCEDEDDDDYSSYKTSAPVDNSADDRDYAATDAARDVGDRFGIADEVRFWTAVGLSALAVTAAVIGIIDHSKANEARDAYDSLNELSDLTVRRCEGNATCEEIMVSYVKSQDLRGLQNRIDQNKKTQDSYTSARNIWFGISAASIAGAVVLFVW